MNRVALNARFKTRPVTGVERFAIEVSDRLSHDSSMEMSEISPAAPIQGLKGHAWEQLALPRQIGRDAVLFSPCNTGPISVKRQFVVIHDAAVWDCPDGFSGAFRQVYQQLLPRLAKRSLGVATVSEFSRKQLAPRLGIPEEKILVLGNAVSKAFSPNGNLNRPARDEIELLCVGSMDPRKNLARLVRAWLDLKKHDRLPENAVLNLVGGANPRNFADFERAEDISLRWHGRVGDEELVRHYRHADAFIFPSTYEGFGLPPLEAMACGCPVLLSHAASLPEVGGSGFDPSESDSNGAVMYFDPHSDEEIKAAILRFLELAPEKRRRLRDNALGRAATFSWDHIAGQVAGGIQQVAS
ncbi:MAG: glycosyltransferase family 4 protein [Verrucomicrobiae bacterium]|nr:glycosyltransferase family 4 protein [Verrucomicrobiae bacterium]